MDFNYIEKIDVYKVVNGHVIQIKLVGISTEQTFVSCKDEELTESVTTAINRALTSKQ